MFCHLTCSKYKNTHRPCTDANGSTIQQVWGMSSAGAFGKFKFASVRRAFSIQQFRSKLDLISQMPKSHVILHFDDWKEGFGIWHEELWLFSFKQTCVRGCSAHHVCFWQIRVGSRCQNTQFQHQPFWPSAQHFPLNINGKTGPNCTTERFEGTWSFFKPMAVNSRLPFSSAALIRSLFLPFVHALLLAHPFLVVLMMTDLGVGQATCKVIMGKWTCRTHGPLTSILTLTATASN